MYFISKILWSQVFAQGNSEKFTISYQIKHEKFAVSSPPLPLFSFNLLVKLMAAIREVCQRVYICMCVY